MMAVRSRRSAPSMHVQPSLLVVTTVPMTVDGFLVPYLEHFSGTGWRVGVATGAGELSARTLAAVDTVHVVAWTRSPWNVLRVLGAVRHVRHSALSGNYDLVHVHTPIAAAVTRAAMATVGRRRRPAVVYTAHGFHFMPGQPRLRRWPAQLVEWIAGRWTDRLIVINDTDYRSAQRLRLVRTGRLTQFPGIGLDLDWYRATPELVERAAAVRGDLALEAEDVLIAMIGELLARKGPQDAINALARLGRSDVHLAIAGTGPYQSALQRQVTELKLAGQVHFLAHVPDVRPLVLASRATTLPSYREGLSRAVLESLALGVPVVGSDIRGIADSVLPDGGILVPPGDVAALAAAFGMIADAPPVHDARRAAIAARLERYSVTSLIADHVALYREVLAEREHRR
jgi:glycosyltransferase involved in cell wall biosynthesis